MRKLLTENGSKIFVDERAYGVQPGLLRDAKELLDIYAPQALVDGAVVRMFYASPGSVHEARLSVARITGCRLGFSAEETSTGISVGGEEYIILRTDPSYSYEGIGGMLLHELCHVAQKQPIMFGYGPETLADIATCEYFAEKLALDIDPMARAVVSDAGMRSDISEMAIGVPAKGQKISLSEVAGICGAWNAHLTHNYPHKEQLLPAFERVVAHRDKIYRRFLEPEDYAFFKRTKKALLAAPLKRETVVEAFSKAGE